MCNTPLSIFHFRGEVDRQSYEDFGRLSPFRCDTGHRQVAHTTCQCIFNMDPFSALGLASNIISLVDFTSKLVAGTKAIYQSQSGTSEETAVLETITQDIRRLDDAIVIDDAHSGALRSLATESKNMADQLLQAIDRLRAGSKHSPWTSFKAALRDVWSRSEIQALYRRLSELQRQITAHIQYLMG